MVQIKNNDLPAVGSYKYFDLPELKNELLVYRKSDGEFTVYSSFCPHFGGPLSIKNGNIYCHFHDYIFDIETGQCKNKNLGALCQKYSYFYDSDGLHVEVL